MKWLALILGVTAALLGGLLGRIAAILVTWVMKKFDRATDDPIMKTRVNAGSDDFLAESRRYFPLRELKEAIVPSGRNAEEQEITELDIVRNLWPKSVHKPRKRDRLPDVREPADPGDGALQAESEPGVDKGPVLP